MRLGLSGICSGHTSSMWASAGLGGCSDALEPCVPICPEHQHPGSRPTPTHIPGDEPKGMQAAANEEKELKRLIQLWRNQEIHLVGEIGPVACCLIPSLLPPQLMG